MDTKKLPHLCSWLCRAWMRSRLCCLLLIICMASVGLNILLLASSYSNTTESKRSAVLKPRSVLTPMTTNHQDPIRTPLLPPGLDLNEPEITDSGLVRQATPPQSGSGLVKSIKKSTLLERGRESQVPKNAPSTHLRMPLCPLDPPGLAGLSKPFLGKTDFKTIRSLFPGVEKGGRIRPANCTARQRLAVIIPFRNRHTHLAILLRNLIPFLRKQMADATIFVIEQAPPSTFNRGALLNIGFLEALKTADFDCFMLHDVDLIPLNDRNFYRCGDSPHHYASAINKHRFKLVYETYFGGVVGFSKEQYIKVNGNSNLYFGWGGEDDDLALRTINKNYTLHRHDNITSRYFMVRHSRDRGNDINSERSRIIRSASRRQDVEGLNTVKYQVNSIKLEPLFTWVNVSLDMKDILDTAPGYTKHDMWKLLKMVRFGNIQ